MHSSGARWYYHATYIAFSYFELFTDYKDDIFKVSYLHIKLEMWGSKFGGNIKKKTGEIFEKLIWFLITVWKRFCTKYYLLWPNKHKLAIGTTKIEKKIVFKMWSQKSTRRISCVPRIRQRLKTCFFCFI